jgi:nicotinamide riboside kinase
MVKLNFYGGPGSGKSTLAARVYAALKEMNMRAELVREYAKELVYEGRDMKTLTEAERLALLAEQLMREERVKDVQFLITDSPMLLTAYFHPYEYAKDIVKRHLKENELHFWVVRPEHFESEDRSHSKQESIEIDQEMKQFLKKSGAKLLEIEGSGDERLYKILFALKDKKLIK